MISLPCQYDPVIQVIERAFDLIRENASLSRPIEFSIVPYLPFACPGSITKVEHIGSGLLHYSQTGKDWEGYYW